MSRISAAAFSDTKPHYDLLDGLRGVAALTVVCFHLFEAYATSHLDQRINHGYLAVDLSSSSRASSWGTPTTTAGRR